MEKSHNIFGSQEYGLSPMRVVDIKDGPNGITNKLISALIIKETENYRKNINTLMNRSYPTMLGVSFALEQHAGYMLNNFRIAFSKSRYNLALDTYKNDVEIYFNCHLDNGVEDRHAIDAKQCVLNNCRSDKELIEIIYGIEETLKIQEKMWDGMFIKAKQLINN